MWRSGKTIPLERTTGSILFHTEFYVISLIDYFFLGIHGFLIKVPWRIKGNLVNKMVKGWMHKGWSPSTEY